MTGRPEATKTRLSGERPPNMHLLRRKIIHYLVQFGRKISCQTAENEVLILELSLSVGMEIRLDSSGRASPLTARMLRFFNLHHNLFLSFSMRDVCACQNMKEASISVHLFLGLNLFHFDTIGQSTFNKKSRLHRI